ncbi:MAG: alpha/beta fold hydrolase [Deltaproteobacteria bacterium]|nr:alpha/beta fold hydrolase [Deltaproteobacteria bacterium]
MSDVAAAGVAMTNAWVEGALGMAAATMGGLPWGREPVALAQTARDVVMRDGPATLLRFRGSAAPRSRPLLLVPSLINRWYVLDLRPGSSLVEALVSAGLDVWCLDWGVARDEDRYFGWDDVVARLGRAARRVRRTTGGGYGILGYCMGATVSAIHAALEPYDVRAFVNLAGPIDFSRGGRLTEMVDRQWFDAEAVADAGNVSPPQMQSGFVALRPTAQMAKWVGMVDRGHALEARASFEALERWASDNVPFPAEAYRTYIGALYQRNELARGEHHVAGRRVSLSQITCPLMTIVAERDVICPPEAALALETLVGSGERDRLVVPGGHVGAVVGSRASRRLYPALAAWLARRLDHEGAR